MSANRILFSLLCFFLMACTSSSSPELPPLADDWVKSHPDSALTLLDGILFPEELPLARRAEYARLRALACEAGNKSFAQDTLLAGAIRYYEACGDSDRLFACYRLDATRLLDKEDSRSSLNSLLLAERFLTQAADSARPSLYNRIAQLALTSSRYDLARCYAGKMTALADSSFQTLGYYTLAIAFEWEGNTEAHPSYLDSAFYYMEKTVQLAEAHPDVLLPHYLRNSLTPKLPASEALRRLHKVIALEGESCNVLASIARVFLEARQPDSAACYLNRADENYAQMWQSRGREYVSMRNELSVLRSCLNYARGQKDFFVFPGPFNDSIYFSGERNKRIWEEQSRLQHHNSARNFYYQQQRQRTQMLLLGLGFGLLMVVAGILFYVRRRRNRWIEAEERAETLQRLLDDASLATSDASRDSHFFKKILLQQLGIIRLIATAPTEQNKELLQQIARISSCEVPADSLLNWADLYPVIDSLFDGFHTRLLQHFGSLLNEREVQLCCLLAAGFSTKEISVVSGHSPRTVYQRKSDIRRKLQLEEAEDIVSGIREKIRPNAVQSDAL